jgi:phage tail-like protein
MEFTVNAHRRDPYKRFRFRVRWDGEYVAGVSRVSGLTRTTDVVLHRDGDEPNQQLASPGLTAWEPISLERGRTHDPAFERWAGLVHDVSTGGVALAGFRKDIVIDLFNEAGQRVMSFLVYRCWPSQYTALGQLDGRTSAVAFETLVLQHEGWMRDEAVGEPDEPKTLAAPPRRRR